MDDGTNSHNLWQTIINSPTQTVLVTHGAAVSGILTYLGIITPILGFISVIIGVSVGCLSFRIQFKKLKALEQHEKAKGEQEQE